MGAFLSKIWNFIVKYHKQIMFVVNIIIKLIQIRKQKTMTEEKGILTKAVEKWAGKELVVLINAKGFWKPVIAFGLPKLIQLLDDNLGEKVPLEYREQLRDSIDNVILEKDYDEAVHLIMDLADDFIDVPGLDDEAERKMFEALGSMICAVLHALKKDNSDIEAPAGTNE